MKEIDISEIEGFVYGNKENKYQQSGCTVVISEDGAVAGVDVRGGAPGTRETDALESENIIQKVHGLFLAGGSAFGLDVGSGVAKFLEEKGIGFDVGITKVPIVPGAILFDLKEGYASVRPDAAMGYAAARSSFMESRLKQGNFGAGAGCSVGKLQGSSSSMKGGLGHYAFQIGEVQVGAIVAVNCFGDVVHPDTGKIIAGLHKEGQFLNSEKMLMDQFNTSKGQFSGNTTIGVVVTNAIIDKPAANKLASISHNGLARTIRPSHTFVDGDTMYFMGSGRASCDGNRLGVMAVKAVENAVFRGVSYAESTETHIAAKDMQGGIME